jgi:transcriptional regulator with XRE-family HTH domain
MGTLARVHFGGCEYEKALLKAHSLHAGIYCRLANQLGVDPSYVSRVATGRREGPKILRALLDELHQIQLIFARLESYELGDGELSNRPKLKTYKTTVARAKASISQFRAKKKAKRKASGEPASVKTHAET